MNLNIQLMNLHRILLHFVLRKIFIISVVFLFLAIFFSTSYSQSAGEFRTIAGGNWTDAIWQKYNGVAWGNSPSPTSAEGIINVLHPVSLNLNITLDQLVISSTLTISAGDSLTIVNGISTDLVLNGTITGPGNIYISPGTDNNLSGTISGSGTMILAAGSTCSSNSVTLDRILTNNGILNFTISHINGTGTIFNNSTINIGGSGINIYPSIMNGGTINKQLVGTTQLLGNLTNLSSGVINISAGNFYFSAYSFIFDIGGIINVSSGSILQLSSSYSVYNISGIIQGAGNFVSDSKVNFLSGSTYNISGNTTAGGTLTFNAGMNFINIGTVISSGGGTLNLQPGLVVSSYNPAFVFQGGTVNFNTGKKFVLTLGTISGTIAGSDTLDVSGTINFSGAFEGTGIINFLEGSTFSFNFGGINNSKTINNLGTFNWNSYQISMKGTINNYNVLNIGSPSGQICSNLINNFGVINKSNTTTYSLTGGCNNSGTINITGGGLSILPNTGSYTSSGSFNVASLCALTIGQTAGTASHTITGSISGAGNVTLSAQSVTFGPGSVYNITGNTTATTGAMDFNSAMTLTNLGNLIVSGATVNFPPGLIIGSIGSTLTFPSGTINFNTGRSYTFNQIDLGGTIAGTDTTFITTTLNWTANGFSNVGVLKPGGTAINNQNYVTINGKYINRGTHTWGAHQFIGTGTFENEGVFNISTSAAYIFSIPIINNGTINKTTGYTTTFSGNMTNNLVININAGTINSANGINTGMINIFGGAYFNITGTFTSDGSIVLNPNANITGNGTLNYNGLIFTNNGNVSLNFLRFGSATNISGSGVINPFSCTILNTGNLSLASNHQFQTIVINSGGLFNLNGYKASFNGTGTVITNNGTINTANSTVEYNSASGQTISTANINYGNLIVNNPAGTSISGTLNINDTLNILSGFLNLNQNNIVLGNAGYLRETSACTVRGTGGTISTTRNLNAPEGENIAGLGAAITSAANLGSTTISRGHTVYTLGGAPGIKRYYNISPANNTGLNATLTYHYDNYELNGLNKNFLALYKSTNSGTNWSMQGGTKDTSNNNITYSGINSFSYWAASYNSLAASVNITAIVDGLFNTQTNTLNKKDSLFVYLRNTSAPFAIIDSAKIMLDSVTFSANAYFNYAPSGTYYITVKYRNALELWSKSGGEIYTTGTSMSYNFTSSQSQSYGNCSVLKNGMYCIVSGDLNQDGFVNGNDFTIFSQQFGQSGYLRADLNGDNNVNGNDFTSFSVSFGKQSIHP